MSKKSFKTCNNEGQKLRWRIKVRKRKLMKDWSIFKNDQARQMDRSFFWARMNRSLTIIHQCLTLLDDKKRVKEIERIVGKIMRKMEPFQKMYKDITPEYKSKAPPKYSTEYHRTLLKHIHEL